MDISDIERKIGDTRCVSFDIFDTLIIRPYVRPTDLFRHIERLQDMDGFAASRISAERQARKRRPGEITLDEIYQEIDSRFKGMMDLEIRMEIDLALPNEDIRGLLQRLSAQGKRIILISDMYLPEDVIRAMLDKCGIGYEGLYLSSAIGSTKHDGSLFRYVLEDLGIDSGDLFHIGDNRHSDCNIPRSLGIKALRVERPIERYWSEHPDEHRFYNRTKSLERSIIVSMDMINGTSDNIWFDIGRRFGGPLTASFSISINSNGSEDGLYLYASRDGYNIKRVSEKLYSDRKTEYVYTQRLILGVLSENDLPYGRLELPSRVKDRYHYEKKVSAMRRILRFFRKELDLTVTGDDRKMQVFYNDHVDVIDGLRKTRLKQYTDYLIGMCQSSDIHLIDCTTMKFSSQRLMESVIGRKVKGHYLVVLSEGEDVQYDTMCKWHYPVIGWGNVDVPEFFLCSPEYPLSGWDNGPVFDKDDRGDAYRVSIYDDVSDGESDYAARYQSVFRGYMIPFDYWSVVKWSELSVAGGTEYRRMMKRIMWASNPDHTDYVSLVTGSLDVRQILRKIIYGAIDRINRE